MEKIFAALILAGVFASATTTYAGGYSSTLNCGDFQLVRHVNDYNYETPTFDELVDSNGNQIAYSDRRSSDFKIASQGDQVIVKIHGQSYSCHGLVGSPNNSGE